MGTAGFQSREVSLRRPAEVIRMEPLPKQERELTPREREQIYMDFTNVPVFVWLLLRFSPLFCGIAAVVVFVMSVFLPWWNTDVVSWWHGMGF